MNGCFHLLLHKFYLFFLLPTVSIVFEIAHFVQFAFHITIWYSIVFYMKVAQKVGMYKLPRFPFKISRTEIFLDEIGKILYCVH